MFDKNLTANTFAPIPANICQYVPKISNCLTMADEVRECEQCIDTYYSKNNECLDCLIPNCKKCEEKESEGVVFTQCLLCDDSYDLVKDFVLGTRNTTRDVCGWTRKIENCAVHDPNNRLICSQCRDGFYFNSDIVRCDECSSELENCLRCNQQGTECTQCDIGFSVRQSDKSCWEPHCDVFSAPDFCSDCADGYYLQGSTGLCVSDCSELDPDLENDEDNFICRKACPDGEYNDPTRADVCLGCVDDGDLNNCELCSWDGRIGDANSELICNSCQDGFTPVPGGCVRTNCDEFDPENKDSCTKCKLPYYLMFDDTRCVASCPTDTLAVELDGMNWCAPVCDPGFYVDTSAAQNPCQPCSDVIDSCSVCHYDQTSAAVVCQECEDDMFPTWRGEKCSLCTYDQYEETNGQC